MRTRLIPLLLFTAAFVAGRQGTVAWNSRKSADFTGYDRIITVRHEEASEPLHLTGTTADSDPGQALQDILARKEPACVAIQRVRLLLEEVASRGDAELFAFADMVAAAFAAKYADAPASRPVDYDVALADFWEDVGRRSGGTDGTAQSFILSNPLDHLPAVSAWCRGLAVERPRDALAWIRDREWRISDPLRIEIYSSWARTRPREAWSHMVGSGWHQAGGLAPVVAGTWLLANPQDFLSGAFEASGNAITPAAALTALRSRERLQEITATLIEAHQGDYRRAIEWLVAAGAKSSSAADPVSEVIRHAFRQDHRTGWDLMVEFDGSARVHAWSYAGEFSDGLDSATIAGYLQRLLPASGSDWRTIEALAGRFATAVQLATPDPVKRLLSIADSPDLQGEIRDALRSAAMADAAVDDWDRALAIAEQVSPDQRPRAVAHAFASLRNSFPERAATVVDTIGDQTMRDHAAGTVLYAAAEISPAGTLAGIAETLPPGAEPYARKVARDFIRMDSYAASSWLLSDSAIRNSRGGQLTVSELVEHLIETDPWAAAEWNNMITDEPARLESAGRIREKLDAIQSRFRGRPAGERLPH